MRIFFALRSLDKISIIFLSLVLPCSGGVGRFTQDLVIRSFPLRIYLVCRRAFTAYLTIFPTVHRKTRRTGPDTPTNNRHNALRDLNQFSSGCRSDRTTHTSDPRSQASYYNNAPPPRHPPPLYSDNTHPRKPAPAKPRRNRTSLVRGRNRGMPSRNLRAGLLRFRVVAFPRHLLPCGERGGTARARLQNGR